MPATHNRWPDHYPSHAYDPATPSDDAWLYKAQNDPRGRHEKARRVDDRTGELPHIPPTTYRTPDRYRQAVEHPQIQRGAPNRAGRDTTTYPWALVVAGGALIVAATSLAGAWAAEHQATDAKRRASQLGRQQAQLEQRLQRAEIRLDIVDPQGRPEPSPEETP